MLDSHGNHIAITTNAGLEKILLESIGVASKIYTKIRAEQLKLGHTHIIVPKEQLEYAIHNLRAFGEIFDLSYQIKTALSSEKQLLLTNKYYKTINKNRALVGRNVAPEAPSDEISPALISDDANNFRGLLYQHLQCWNEEHNSQASKAAFPLPFPVAKAIIYAMGIHDRSHSSAMENCALGLEEYLKRQQGPTR